MLRAEIIVPTVQFGNITYFVEGSAEEINEMADYYLSLRKQESGEGLNDKEWNNWLDEYIAKGTGDADKYNQMSKDQMHVIQCIKKSVKRIKSRNGDNEIN